GGASRLPRSARWRPATSHAMSFTGSLRVECGSAGRNTVERRAHLIQQIVSRNIRVAFRHFVSEGHRVLSKRNLVGKPLEVRISYTAAVQSVSNCVVIEVYKDCQSSFVVL